MLHLPRPAPLTYNSIFVAVAHSTVSTPLEATHGMDIPVVVSILFGCTSESSRAADGPLVPNGLPARVVRLLPEPFGRTPQPRPKEAVRRVRGSRQA